MDTNNEVLEFDCNVRAYPPKSGDGYWRVRWEEAGRRRDTTARSRSHAITKATELVARLSRGTATDLGKADGAELIANYLDPARRGARGNPWSVRHRDEQVRYCSRYVAPQIGSTACRRLSRADLQRVMDEAPTVSVAQHLRRCLTGLVTAGLEEGHLLPRQDLLRGVRWRPPGGVAEPESQGIVRAITEAEIPTAEMVHALAAATAHRPRPVWWRELEILLVAYSGLRWGEHVALTADRIDATRRRITVDRQVIETRSAIKLSLPKSRRRRVTMYPATTPGGIDLAALVEKRLIEIGPQDLLFPAARGAWARRSNYGRNLWDPAAASIGWPRTESRWTWTFHSLRHVFATWALNQPGLRLEDVSRLLGHSSIRVTQDIYIHVSDDLYERFYNATE
jgi:integrase